MLKFLSNSPFLSLLLIPVLAASPVLAETGPAIDGASGSDANLQLRVSESDGPASAITSQSKAPLSFQVVDSSGAPVASAAVAVRLPEGGSTGTFWDGAHSAVAYTDADGRVSFKNIFWGDTPGVVAIRVVASKGEAHAGILLERQLMAEAAPVPSPAAQPASYEVVAQNAALPSAPPMQPGALRTDASVPGTSKADQSTSATQTLASAPQAAAAADPQVTVSTPGKNPPQAVSSKTKWILLAVAIAGAGAGVAMVGKGKSSGSTNSTTSTAIGNPTLSIGHP